MTIVKKKLKKILKLIGFVKNSVYNLLMLEDYQ